MAITIAGAVITSHLVHRIVDPPGEARDTGVNQWEPWFTTATAPTHHSDLGVIGRIVELSRQDWPTRVTLARVHPGVLGQYRTHPNVAIHVTIV